MLGNPGCCPELKQIMQGIQEVAFVFFYSGIRAIWHKFSFKRLRTLVREHKHARSINQAGSANLPGSYRGPETCRKGVKKQRICLATFADRVSHWSL
jgi:hypothetical protein